MDYGADQQQLGIGARKIMRYVIITRFFWNEINKLKHLQYFETLFETPKDDKILKMIILGENSEIRKDFITSNSL
jgi:hypothetical protein